MIYSFLIFVVSAITIGAQAPTARPTTYGDASLAPTTECLKWVLGYSRDDCNLACSRVGRVCRPEYFADINDLASFTNMVENAHYFRNSFTPGTASDLCADGINVFEFAQAPAVFSWNLYVTPGGDTSYRPETHCVYPTPSNPLNDACDTVYDNPPSQRFCPCASIQCAPPAVPTIAPTERPTEYPTEYPTIAPSYKPTELPTADPTLNPTGAPAPDPTYEPTYSPSTDPSQNPTQNPTFQPTFLPTVTPTATPTETPTCAPSLAPTRTPTTSPTADPTTEPTLSPSSDPTCDPTYEPTLTPSAVPSVEPTLCFVWILGFTQENCDDTCSHSDVNGVCDETVLANTYGREMYDQLVAESYLLGSTISGITRPNNTDSFCNLDIQNTADAPLAYAFFTIYGGPPPYLSEEWVCLYPETIANVTADCSKGYSFPSDDPSQRFCPCNIADCAAWETSRSSLRRLTDVLAESDVAANTATNSVANAVATTSADMSNVASVPIPAGGHVSPKKDAVFSAGDKQVGVTNRRVDSTLSKQLTPRVSVAQQERSVTLTTTTTTTTTITTSAAADSSATATGRGTIKAVVKRGLGMSSQVKKVLDATRAIEREARATR